MVWKFLQKIIFKYIILILAIFIILAHDASLLISVIVIIPSIIIDFLKNHIINTNDDTTTSRNTDLYVKPKMQVRVTGLAFLVVIALFPFGQLTIVQNRLIPLAEWALDNIGILRWRFGISTDPADIEAISYAILSQLFLALLVIAFAAVSVLSMSSRRSEYLASVDQTPAIKRAAGEGARAPELFCLLITGFFIVGASLVPLGGPEMCGRCPAPDQFIGFVVATFFWVCPMIFIHFHVIHAGLRMSESK